MGLKNDEFATALHSSTRRKSARPGFGCWAENLEILPACGWRLAASRSA